jgi:uncharacterized membrane protein YgcG
MGGDKRHASSNTQLFVPRAFVGSIMGIGGANLRSVRASTGARVDVATKNVDGLRCITVSGTVEQVEAANSLLNAKLGARAGTNGDGHGGSGTSGGGRSSGGGGGGGSCGSGGGAGALGSALGSWATGLCYGRE